MIIDQSETNDWTTDRLFRMYHHPELADMYLEALQLLHSLSYTIIDDRLDALVAGDNLIDAAVVVSDISDIFITCLHAAIAEHGIIFAEDCTAEELFIFLQHLVLIGDYEDRSELLGIMDANDDPIECLISLLEAVGDVNSYFYFDKITYLTDPVIPNLRTILSTTVTKLEPVAPNPAIRYAKRRLGFVPDEVKSSSLMYELLEDGYGLGFALDTDSHTTLTTVVSQHDSVKDMIHEVRIFLLASSLPDDDLRRYFNHIVEKMLPDDAASALFTVTKVGYEL